MRVLLWLFLFWMPLQVGLSQSNSVNPFDLPERLPDSLQNVQISPTGEVQTPVAPILVKKQRPQVKGSHFAIWFLPFLLCLIAWALSMDRSVIQSLYKSVNNLNFLNLMYRDARTRLTPALVILYAVFLGSAAYFVRFGLSYFLDVEMPSFFIVFLVLLGIYLVRTLVMRLIHFAFMGPIEIAQYDYTIFIFSIILGLLLLPLDIFIAFGPDSLAIASIWCGLGVILLVFLFRSFRGILLSTTHLSRNTFRYFMYICTLEIAPILLIIKVLGASG